MEKERVGLDTGVVRELVWFDKASEALVGQEGIKHEGGLTPNT